jgi:hypothetical protein
MASKKQLDTLADQAAFVFSGTVVKLKAATIPNVPTSNTAVVRVDHLIDGPALLQGIGGREVTVRFKSLAGLKKGSKKTFFTNGWIYGSSIAVDAVGHTAQTERDSIAPLVQASSVGKQDKALRGRLKSADSAVVGTVTKVVRSKKRSTTQISEHDPAWHEATIKVGEVIKGKKTSKVVVLFPGSDDVRWHKIAKYSQGQQGIWLLQKGKKQDKKGIAPKVFAAIPPGPDVLTTLHTADFLPLSELGKVKSLKRD